MGRNPQTGAPVKIAAKRVFKFMPAKALKDAVMAKRGARKGGSGQEKSRSGPQEGDSEKSTAAKRPAAKKTARKAAKKSRR